MSLIGSIAGGIAKAAGSAVKKASSGGSKYSGGSGGRGSGGGGSKWSGYGKNTNWSNESAYLSKLAQGNDPGKAAWAKQQQAALDAAYGKYNSGYGGSSKKYDNEYESMYNPYQDLMEEQERQYAELQRQQEAARRAAIEQGVQRIESNRGTINQGYDETARQAYVQKMQNKLSLPQTLAGQGISGGASESANIALDTAYGNNINENELARQNAMSGLDQAISDLRSSGDIGIAESNLALQQQRMADYSSTYQNKIAQDNWIKQYEQGMADSSKADYVNTIGAYADDYAAEINRLKAMGISEDDYRIKNLRAVRNEKVAEMQAAAAAAAQQQFDNDYKTQKLYNDTRKTDWSVGKPYYKPTTSKSGAPTMSQAIRMAEMGEYPPWVKKMLEMK